MPSTAKVIKATKIFRIGRLPELSPNSILAIPLCSDVSSEQAFTWLRFGLVSPPHVRHSSERRGAGRLLKRNPSPVEIPGWLCFRPSLLQPAWRGPPHERRPRSQSCANAGELCLDDTAEKTPRCAGLFVYLTDWPVVVGVAFFAGITALAWVVRPMQLLTKLRRFKKWIAENFFAASALHEASRWAIAVFLVAA